MKSVNLDQHNYDPIWRCIYCGWSERPKELTKEHILPLSLGGKTVLPKSSCTTCRDATREFERFCSRNIFGRLRIIYDYPTRHPDQRPKTLPLDVTIDGKTERREIPVADYPAIPMTILSWAPPGILTGRPRSQEFHDLTPHIIMPPVKDQSEKLERLGVFRGAQISMPMSFDAVPYSKLIAKFAHVMAVAEYGLNSFKPYLTDLIRGLDDCPSNFVGGASGPFAKTTLPNEQDHEGEIGLLQMGDKRFLCAKIRFFGFLNFPTYIAVVGEPTSDLVQQLSAPAPQEAHPQPDAKSPSDLR